MKKLRIPGMVALALLVLAAGFHFLVGSPAAVVDTADRQALDQSVKLTRDQLSKVMGTAANIYGTRNSEPVAQDKKADLLEVLEIEMVLAKDRVASTRALTAQLIKKYPSRRTALQYVDTSVEGMRLEADIYVSEVRAGRYGASSRANDVFNLNEQTLRYLTASEEFALDPTVNWTRRA